MATGSITKRSKGVYLLRLSCGFAEDGKRRRIVETVKGTREEATRRLRELADAVDGGQVPDLKRLTLGKLIEEHLALSLAAQTLRARTCDDYRASTKRYLGKLADKPVVQVTTRHLEALYADLTKRGLDPQTVHKLHTALRGAFGRAMRWRIIAHNPILGATKAPRLKKRTIRALTAEQARGTISSTASHRMHVLWVFALFTGCRPGEYLALRWQDVDLEARFVKVVRSVYFAPRGTWEFTDPKTTESTREIPISPELVTLLTTHREAQAFAQQLAADKWTELDLVFPGTRGNPMRECHASAIWRALMVELEMPGVRLYDLRHTCATMLLLADSNPGWIKVVSERLGHAGVQQTLDTYAHVLPSMRASASEAMGRILFGDV